MPATKHSHRAWILVDPVQDYEESLEILGVYGSDRAARYAARAHIRREPGREIEAREMRGKDVLRVWIWRWSTRRWALCDRTNCNHNHAEIQAWPPVAI